MPKNKLNDQLIHEVWFSFWQAGPQLAHIRTGGYSPKGFIFAALDPTTEEHTAKAVQNSAITGRKDGYEAVAESYAKFRCMDNGRQEGCKTFKLELQGVICERQEFALTSQQRKTDGV